jgi:hypothetical protein
VTKNSLLPYMVDSNQPAITLPDTQGFKTEKGGTAYKFLQSRLSEIEKQYNDLIDLANDNALVYNAKYNFVPIVGHTYHLYGSSNHYFLSMIGPHEWKRTDFVASFLLTSDNIWRRVNADITS